MTILIISSTRNVPSIYWQSPHLEGQILKLGLLRNAEHGRMSSLSFRFLHACVFVSCLCVRLVFLAPSGDSLQPIHSSLSTEYTLPNQVIIMYQGSKPVHLSPSLNCIHLVYHQCIGDKIVNLLSHRHVFLAFAHCHAKNSSRRQCEMTKIFLNLGAIDSS